MTFVLDRLSVVWRGPTVRSAAAAICLIPPGPTVRVAPSAACLIASWTDDPVPSAAICLIFVDVLPDCFPLDDPVDFFLGGLPDCCDGDLPDSSWTACPLISLTILSFPSLSGLLDYGDGDPA